MPLYPVVILKPTRLAAIVNRHPWIFSGAIESIPDGLDNGSLVHVADRDGQILATGTFSAHSMIAVRILEFGEVGIDRDWIKAKIAAALERRRLLGFPFDGRTTGYRIVYGESDGLPGMVVDRYRDVLVMQLSTAGADRLRDDIVASLIEIFHPNGVYERSDLPSRVEEQLESISGLLNGSVSETVEFMENGRHCLADVVSGQKTGFFLDQRALRQEIFNLAEGRKALDLFSYTGAAAVAALCGGAESVHCIDASESALALCHRQSDLNSIARERLTFEKADVFQWLGARSLPEYDLVMLDPPALIKSHRDLEAGRRAYHFLNRAALRLLHDGGILTTSSCSAFFTEADFALMLNRASQQAGVTLTVLKTVRQSPDHPVSVYFPEAAYLKSFICQIRR